MRYHLYLTHPATPNKWEKSWFEDHNEQHACDMATMNACHYDIHKIKIVDTDHNRIIMELDWKTPCTNIKIL